MSKKKKPTFTPEEKVKIDNSIKEIESLVKDIDKMSDNIATNVNTNVPDIGNSITGMNDVINQLDSMTAQGMFNNPDKDDSEDTDEEYDYYMSDTLKEIWDMVEATPNNMALGKKIRQLYFTTKEATPDPLEEAAKVIKEEEDLTASDFGVTPDDYPYNTEFGTGKTPEEMEAIDRENQQIELFDSEENPNQLNLFSDTK